MNQQRCHADRQLMAVFCLSSFVRERLYMDSPSLQVLCLMDVGSTAIVYPAFKVAYVDAGP